MLKFGNHRVMFAQHQIGVDAVIQCGQPQFLQPRRLGARELGGTQVLQHRSSPHGKRVGEQFRGALGLTERKRLLAQPQQLLELCGVELVGVKKKT